MAAANARPPLALYTISAVAEASERYVLECRNKVIATADASGHPIAQETRAGKYQSRVLQIIEKYLKRTPPIDYPRIAQELASEADFVRALRDPAADKKRERDRDRKREQHAHSASNPSSSGHRRDEL